MMTTTDMWSRTMADYVTQYGTMDAAFVAALTGQMSREEYNYFEAKFFTSWRCYHAAAVHLREKYGSLLKALNAYYEQATTVDDEALIELGILPNLPKRLIE